MSAAKLMVMAGGTGGHVFPALAVAQGLQKLGVDVVWLGTRAGLEAKVVPANDIAIRWVSVEGLVGKGKLAWLMAPFQLLRAMWQSAKILRAEKPNCVLGMGGFVSGPGALTARLMGKRLVVHEQNAVAGLTNRVLAKIANVVLSGFPNVKGLPDSAHWVGNPVREGIAQATKANTAATPPIKILIIGGSQGAHSFNQFLPDQLAKLGDVSVEIWHQTGRGNQSSVEATYQGLGLEARVSEFIDDMASAYAWADLLICRAGAMTIAELCAASKASLLVPFPYSAGGHQDINAAALVNASAAQVVSNADLQQAKLLPVLTGLLAKPSELAEMGRRAHELHKVDALEKVIAICQEQCYA